ncbi:peptidylprolyl isomerase [Sphingomonas montanisoli]|uniref:peptidylprolyl isomerase n=1 Tax=Sphingomonas montanisoli TaxID=2606412 RepID=A0A5D9C6I3_9SPHN|nr:peptidylprolyl isomerase [Sphingomonas montanisoli]TZG27289.1 peptidylprolyl isomerase [Sphingomonas montanisoli]
MNITSRPIIVAIPLLFAAAAFAQATPAKPKTSAEIVAAAPASAWKVVADEDLLMIDLDGGQRVVIALAPAFAPVHVANIRALVRAGWFAGITVNRVQDNYVVQWGDATEKKPLPAGIVTPTPAEYERPLAGLKLRPLGYRDAYAQTTGHVGFWPVVSDGNAAWLTHCYGMVGVGRGLAPDTGSGAELYAVTGHAPRHLDRNIATVGRVIDGIEALTALPRGTEALGFYKEGTPRPAISRATIAADLPAAQRPHYQLLDSASPAFGEWVTARANRKDDFFIRPAGAVDICNALPPVRKSPV